jgi:hypothetical protein
MNKIHRLSINRPTKREKEKSPSDGHCQCKKEMDDHLLAFVLFLKESYIVTRFVKKRASFLKINYINISFFGTSDCHHCYYSVSGNANSMIKTPPFCPKSTWVTEDTKSLCLLFRMMYVDTSSWFRKL